MSATTNPMDSTSDHLWPRAKNKDIQVDSCFILSTVIGIDLFGGGSDDNNSNDGTVVECRIAGMSPHGKNCLSVNFIYALWRATARDH
jgi:hypothetical protein